MKKTYEIYIGIGLGIIALIILIIFIDKIASLFSAPGTRDYRKEIDNGNLTMSESDYRTLADTLFRAFNGWGTDENTVYTVLGYLNTKDDWLKLVTVYGKDEDGFNLPGRLIYELDKREQQKVRDILSRINVQL